MPRNRTRPREIGAFGASNQPLQLLCCAFSSARERSKQHGLVQARTSPYRPLPGMPTYFMLSHMNIAEFNRVGRGKSLSEPIPIVINHHTISADWNNRHNTAARFVYCGYRYPLRITVPRAIDLPAVQSVSTLRVSFENRIYLAQGCSVWFGRRISEEVSRNYPSEQRFQIGRASCRQRGEVSSVAR